MSVQAVEELFRRLSSDAQFKARFKADPEAVLSGFELTDEEKEAVKRAHRRLGHASLKSAAGSKPVLEPWIGGPEPVAR